MNVIQTVQQFATKNTYPTDKRDGLKRFNSSPLKTHTPLIKETDGLLARTTTLYLKYRRRLIFFGHIVELRVTPVLKF